MWLNKKIFFFSPLQQCSHCDQLVAAVFEGLGLVCFLGLIKSSHQITKCIISQFGTIKDQAPLFLMKKLKLQR